MRIAFLADLHITDCAKSIKADVLEWLENELRQKRPDLLVLIGDMTAMGTEGQSQRLHKWLDAIGIPYCSTPGNAELRTSPEMAVRWRIASPADVPVILVDSSRGTPSLEELLALERLPDNAGFLLATHVPTDAWPQDAIEVLEKARVRRAVTAVVGGHQHVDGESKIRGLDPDKASGGPPMYCIFDNDAGAWRREDIAMNGADIRTWPEIERQRLFSRFGVSAMKETLETLETASTLHIPHIELRSGSIDVLPKRDVVAAVARWREAGGMCLSIHLPSLLPEDEQGRLRACVQQAVRLGCDRVTLHVPAVTPVVFPSCRSRLLENFLRDMAPLLECPVDIGIENLHTSPEKTDDMHRNYGCTIDECRSWIETLRAATGSKRIGFHLDIGHARNNPPFNSVENLSDFYAELGGIANGCHVHQVSPVAIAGESGNHQPFIGLYDKLISLAGFFYAWRKGQFPLIPPLFLEIRGSGLGIQTYLRLRYLILGY